MDDFLQNASASPLFLFLVLPALGLLVQYLLIRLAIIHSLRDHQKWLEARRRNASRSSQQWRQDYPSITPDAHEPFSSS